MIVNGHGAEGITRELGGVLGWAKYVVFSVASSQLLSSKHFLQ